MHAPTWLLFWTWLDNYSSFWFQVVDDFRKKKTVSLLLLKSLSLIPFDMFRKISASKFPMGVTCLEERPRDHLGVLLNKSCITTSLHSTLESELTNLDSILKSRNITLTTKVHLVKAMVFLVVMYGCESWIIKKTEHQRIDAFELWC